jgi:hypothetical protein
MERALNVTLRLHIREQLDSNLGRELPRLGRPAFLGLGNGSGGRAKLTNA